MVSVFEATDSTRVRYQMADPHLLPDLTCNLSDALLRHAGPRGADQVPGWFLFAVKHEDTVQLLFLPIGPHARVLYALPYRQYFGLDREDAEFLGAVKSGGPVLTRLERLALRYADGILHGLRQGLESSDA